MRPAGGSGRIQFSGRSVYKPLNRRSHSPVDGDCLHSHPTAPAPLLGIGPELADGAVAFRQSPIFGH